MAKTVADLLDILTLEPLENNLFRGRRSDVGWRRVFGGLVLAQALAAACRTVEDRSPHSLHAYFLLPGDPSAPIIYEVERIRDGRSFATRRVVAVQQGRAIFALSASFQREEAGLEHQAAMPEAPAPDSLVYPDEDDGDAEAAAAIRSHFERQWAIELRPVDPLGHRRPEGERKPQLVWLRAVAPLPDDPALHQCALAYASDITLLDTAARAHGRSVAETVFAGASLDHALWFHRPFRMDDWLLYVQESPFTGGGRGFARGQVFRRDGVLVASVAQEGVVRLRRGGS